MKKILDLGCGKSRYKGYEGAVVIGVDVDQNSDADVIHNLNKFPYPFKDNEFDMIFSEQVFQFLKGMNKVYKEIHRIAKPNALVKVIVPHFSSYWAYGRLDTKQVFSCEQIRFLEKGGSGCKPPAKFKVRRIRLFYGEYSNPIKSAISKVFTFLANLNPFFCERFWCYWVGGFSELHFELEVIK